MPGARPEAILFDLDGTLADTAPDLGATANLLREECGLAPLPLDQLRPHTSSGVRGMLRVAFGIGTEHTHYAGLAERFLDRYADRLCIDTRLYEGIPELLSTLDAYSIEWGVVTNKRQRFTHPLIEALGLAQRTRCVISGDSAERPKPAPDPLLLACRVLSVRPDRCVYVGDDLRDIVAGKAAGMGTVAAAYGYLGVDTPITRWEADAIIETPGELLGVIGIRAW
ncbi:MAG: HAD-IA family hydrolase [Rhodocyclaceae bacterium]|nr:HAD-IA family hydrolase [Rhodocyclaceae bacterium]